MKKRILLIDDDRLVLASIEKLLVSNNYEVCSCQSGVEAIKAFENQRFDLIISDVRMSEQDGIKTIKKIRELEVEQGISQTPIIIITGYASEDVPIQAIKAGVQDYFLKPLDNRELLKSIEFHLEKTYKKLRKLYDKESVEIKADYFSQLIGKPLRHIKGCTYDTEYFKGNIENPIGVIQIPLGISGPLRINGKNANGDFYVPMATSEGVLVLTYDLGMRLLRMGDPVETEVISKKIHISPMFIIENQQQETLLRKFIEDHYQEIKKTAESRSRHTKLLNIEQRRINDNYVLKCIYDTGDAHGLNMINEATYNLCTLISEKTKTKFFLRSHYSAVKHHSLRNEKEGYGKKVKAKVIIVRKAFEALGVSAIQVKDFTDRCKECAKEAEVSAVNVHASNGITAVCLATGQDMADISSSHVCQSYCELTNDKKDLYFEVTLPNLLVATVGGGTGLGTQKECLEIMDCYGSGKADKLAEIIAATVLAGEFPTAAAVITGTYVDMHNKYGRNKDKIVL